MMDYKDHQKNKLCVKITNHTVWGGQTKRFIEAPESFEILNNAVKNQIRKI